jgi:hypothetical protein
MSSDSSMPLLHTSAFLMDRVRDGSPSSDLRLGP